MLSLAQAQHSGSQHAAGLFGRQGTGWVGDSPLSSLIPGKQAGWASISIRVLAPTPPSRNPGTLEIKNIKHSWSYVYIYKRGCQLLHPCPRLARRALAPRGRDTLGPSLFFSQQWNVNCGLGLGWGVPASPGLAKGHRRGPWGGAHAHPN